MDRTFDIRRFGRYLAWDLRNARNNAGFSLLVYGVTPIFIFAFFQLCSLIFDGGVSTFGLTSDLTTDGFWEYSPDAFYVVMQKEPLTQAEKKQRAYENKIRHFVLQNYAELQNDIFSNYGEHEYLDTLTSMTKLSKGKIKIIFDHCSNEGECAEKVVDAYISK